MSGIEGLIRFTMKGARELERALKEQAFKHRNATVRALRMEAEAIRGKAMENTVPIDEGVLRGSIHVPPVEDTGYGTVSVRIVAGGPAAPYAVAVHEHPSEASPPSWQGKSISDIKSVRSGEPWSLSGRGPKYLERPMNDSVQGMAERIAAFVKGETGA